MSYYHDENGVHQTTQRRQDLWIEGFTHEVISQLNEEFPEVFPLENGEVKHYSKLAKIMKAQCEKGLPVIKETLCQRLAVEISKDYLSLPHVPREGRNQAYKGENHSEKIGFYKGISYFEKLWLDAAKSTYRGILKKLESINF